MLTISVPLTGDVLIVPVVSAIDVMSVFAPEAAALRFVRAVPATVAPVPPFATGRVPVTCDVRSTPESVPPSVKLPEDVTVPVSVMPLTVPALPTLVTVPVLVVKPEGLLAGYAPKFVKAVAASVAPVPPLATASVPPSVIVPDPVTGPPEVVKPVVPPLTPTDVTVPPPAVDAMVIEPLPFVTVIPDPAVSVALVSVLPVLLPMSNCPSVYVVWLVPPLTTANVPPSVRVPEVVMGPPVSVSPVVPPDPSTLVTVPLPPPPLLVIVKLGYVPVTVVEPAPVKDTIWSGAVLVTVMEPALVIGPPETVMPVPAVKFTLVTVPVPEIVCQYGAPTPPSEVST